MSTASNPKQTTEQRSGQYAKFDEYVDYQVSKTGSNIKANDLLTTAVGISAIFLGYLLVFVLFDHWIIQGGFGHTARLVMLAGVFIACLGWAVWKLVLPYFKKVTHLYSANALEQTSHEMEGSLLNLIDLKQSRRNVNPEIISSLEKRAALTLSQTDTEQAVDRRPLMRLSYVLLFVVAVLCFYALFSPKEIWPSISAAISFSPQREFATQTQINSVTPGNTEVLSGSQLEVIVDLRGEVPDTVTLFYTSSDEGRVDEPLKLRAMDETRKRYQGMIVGINGRGIRQELTYHVQAGDATSEEYHVKVIQPPSATVHSIRYEYPQYMELAAVEQPGGAIDAWEGTKITVDATTNMPITSFEVLFSDEEDSASLLEEFKTEKTINQNSITATWKLKLRADGSFPKFYQIKCRNEAGQTTLSPTVYPLMIRPDQSPEISLLTPKSDLKMPANGIVPISVIAEDPDFKIRYLNLRVDKQQVRVLDKTLFEGAEKSVGLNHDFELGPLRLTPGETIYFWVEARDNKHPSGNRQNTPKIKIEITEPVSQEDAQKQLEEQKQKNAPQKPDSNSDQQNKSESMENKSDKTDQNPSDQPDPDKKEEGQPGQETKPGEENQQEKEGQKSGRQNSQQSTSSEPEQSDEPGAGQKKSGEKQELDSDGGDDQEAIKRILEQLNKEGQQPDSGSEQKQQPDAEKQDSDKPADDPQMQDQKSNGAAGEKNNPSSDAGKGSEGEPQNAPDKSSSPSSSDKADKPDNDPSGKQKPSQSDSVPQGKQEPAAPSDDAMKSKSNGDPKGKATPNHDPDADPRKTDQDVERDPNQKPATRPGQKDSPASDASQKPKPDTPNSKPENTDNPTKADPKEGMRKPEKSDQNPSGKQQPSTNPDSKQKPDQPDGSNEPPQDKGRPTDQKSKQPQNGEKGNSSQNDQGQKGSQQPGTGDSTGQKGNQEQSSQQQPADSKQPMNQPDSNNKSGEKSSDQNQSGQNKSGESKSGEKGGEQSGGDKSGSQGKGQSKSGESSGSSSGQRSGDPQGSGSTKGGPSAAAEDQDSGNASPPGLPEAEDANLEYGKEAANLVLKRIKDELKRKEVDQELLKELGWTKDEMRQFSERLQKQLQSPEQELQSPESLARKRQFEEMLKSLKPANRAAQRERTSSRKQNTDSIGPRRLPVPEEYREAYEAFTRGLSEKKPSDK